MVELAAELYRLENSCRPCGVQTKYCWTNSEPIIYKEALMGPDSRNWLIRDSIHSHNSSLELDEPFERL
jgi:hypothetical protein